MTDRRSFMQTAGAVIAASALPQVSFADAKKVKLNKAIKYAMIKGNAPIKDKFEMIKSIGFKGVETDSPSGMDKAECIAASKSTGIVVHGVIDSVHWGKEYQLSSPDEKAREKGLNAVKQGLQDAADLGATTLLVVPGVVNKEVTYEQCWERSQAELKKALPLAEKLNVKIAIEVVWNGFITKPEQWIEYIDSFKSPYLGGYFDCSNMVKFLVPSADWIRKAGKRVLKFDFKGYSLTAGKDGKGGWVGIGEGSENWPDIIKALGEVGYEGGWATAEVGSGDEKWLREVSDKMDKILELK